MQLAEVFPLAEYIAEELQARGWQTEDAAVRMMTGSGLARDLMVLDLIMCVSHGDDRMVITSDVFDGLARAFGVSAEMLRNLHSTWLRHPDKRSAFVPPDAIFGPTSRRSVIHVVKQ